MVYKSVFFYTQIQFDTLKAIRQSILFFLFAFLLAYSANASHIIGGDLSYLCLGYNPANNTNTYRFTMKVYRNCNQFSMDEFSNPAPVSIYRGANAPYDTIDHIYVPLITPVVDIPPDLSNPCLELPPDICVEEGTYVFEYELPVSNQSYIITYQRCCRNASITNMIGPDRTGATYMIELTAASQRLCNSSPVFNNFPPIVICANEPINFDHSARDREGDQLVYEFCSPLKGAGIGGAFSAGDPTACDGFRPDPSCAPPYPNIDFVFPTYSEQNPMGGSPQVFIDASTGLIDGVPVLLGKYVVGICVKEYRNGELLSITRRDFQFNVADCEPLVDARIQADDVINGQDFVILSCGQTQVPITNLSVQRSNISTFFWEFDIDGAIDRYTAWSPLVSFPDTGIYQGVLVLNPGSACGDTAFINVNIFPEINADFSFTYDTCVAGPVSFTDLSQSEGGPIVDWEWNMANFSFLNAQNPSYQFPDPGQHLVTLAVTDVNGCVDNVGEFIEWFPAPALVVIEPSSFTGCEPLEVTFNNLSTPIDDTYDIIWDFGDGNSSGEISPIHIYEEKGIYSLSVDITSPLGCSVSESWSNWIDVKPTPIADFVFSPQQLNTFQREANFTDLSIDAADWNWQFANFGQSILQNPSFIFPDTGIHEVQLVVTHLLGCQDTLVKFIDVEPQVRYFLPNAFTPNGDDVNDEFKGGGVFAGLRDFSMHIWTRWGELVFESQDPERGWNGRKNNTGKLEPNGVYVCLVRYTTPRGLKKEIKGFATLIK